MGVFRGGCGGLGGEISILYAEFVAAGCRRAILCAEKVADEWRQGILHTKFDLRVFRQAFS